MKLTARQSQVLDIIRRYVDETGYPPTRAEIAAELGFRSANAAEEHLRALARKGAIEMVPGASRGIRLPEAEEDLGLPVIGQVAAGSPILAQEHIEDHCTLQPEFFSPSADYLLRVRGMSMKDIGILDGDLLVGGTLCLHPLVVDREHAGCLDRAQRHGLHVCDRCAEHLVQIDCHHDAKGEHDVCAGCSDAAAVKGCKSGGKTEGIFVQ